MNNTAKPAKPAKRTVVANKIKQIQTPFIIATAAIGAYVIVKQEMDMRAVIVWHDQRISELIETSNQLLEDVRNLQA